LSFIEKNPLAFRTITQMAVATMVSMPITKTNKIALMVK